MNYKPVMREASAATGIFYNKQIKQVLDRLERRSLIDSKLVFEVYYYFYTVVHLILQNANIYKMVRQLYDEFRKCTNTISV